MPNPPSRSEFGRTMRDWRRRRRFSQLDLAMAANVSARHVAFLETGRASPSRSMVITLAAALDVPLRQRNELLRAAGFAALYEARRLDQPELEPIRAAVTQLLHQHEPYPAIVLDHHWNLIDANAAARRLFAPLLARSATEPNLVRLLLDVPDVASIIANWTDVAADLLRRLRVEADHEGGDGALVALAKLLEARVPVVSELRADTGRRLMSHVVIRSPLVGEVSLLPLFAHFGTVEDITVDDLRVELFFPVDASSSERLKAAAEPP